MQNLKNKLVNKEAVIGIIGLGYVGLPLAIVYQKAGLKVIGFDIDITKTESLNDGKSFIHHIKDDDIIAIVNNGFKATNDYSEISKVDCIIICVPTPLSKHKEPDLKYVIDTLNALLPYIKKNQIISLESTTYPGTTEELIIPILEKKEFKVGEDVFVLYSPEREDPGNKDFHTNTIPKIVGGATKNCLEVGIQMYSNIVENVVPVSSTKVAEMTKLLENIHRSVNIGLVNEMKIVADKMEIDIFEVIKAAATKPFGFTPYYPSPGVGGHCIPIDPFYLTWKAKEYGLRTRFIELAGEINDSMPEYTVNQVNKKLNEKKKSIKGSKILVLGVSYKKNVDDARESPSIYIMEILRSQGADVHYSDPFWPKFPKMKNHKFDISSTKLTKENIEKFDCIIIATNHDGFDYRIINKHAKSIVNTRGPHK